MRIRSGLRVQKNCPRQSGDVLLSSKIIELLCATFNSGSSFTAVASKFSEFVLDRVFNRFSVFFKECFFVAATHNGLAK